MELIFSMERIFHPLWSLQSCWLETACNAPQCFQRHAAPPGTKELSQQPSADFGSRVLQMQKRRFLVLIFTGCLWCTLNEFVDLLFTETWPVLKSPLSKKKRGGKQKQKQKKHVSAVLKANRSWWLLMTWSLSLYFFLSEEAFIGNTMFKMYLLNNLSKLQSTSAEFIIIRYKENQIVTRWFCTNKQK